MEQPLNLVSPSRCIARHGGEAAADHRKPLRLAHSVFGFCAAEGRALHDAIAALRTQPRLLPLVEALRAPAPVDPDQAD